MAATGTISEPPDGPRHAVGSRDLAGVVVGDAREGPFDVLEGSPDCRPLMLLIVAELDSETEASALFEVINQRISANARKFGTCVFIALAGLVLGG